MPESTSPSTSRSNYKQREVSLLAQHSAKSMFFCFERASKSPKKEREIANDPQPNYFIGHQRYFRDPDGSDDSNVAKEKNHERTRSAQVGKIHCGFGHESLRAPQLLPPPPSKASLSGLRFLSDVQRCPVPFVPHTKRTTHNQWGTQFMSKYSLTCFTFFTSEFVLT